MNPGHDGFASDRTELSGLAGKANELSDDIRAGLQHDWFEVEKWPDTDPLRPAVITYMTSLRSTLERLSGQTDQLAENLRATASSYEAVDDRHAHHFDRNTHDER